MLGLKDLLEGSGGAVPLDVPTYQVLMTLIKVEDYPFLLLISFKIRSVPSGIRGVHCSRNTNAKARRYKVLRFRPAVGVQSSCD